MVILPNNVYPNTFFNVPDGSKLNHFVKGPSSEREKRESCCYAFKGLPKTRLATTVIVSPVVIASAFLPKNKKELRAVPSDANVPPKANPSNPILITVTPSLTILFSHLEIKTQMQIHKEKEQSDAHCKGGY